MARRAEKIGQRAAAPPAVGRREEASELTPDEPTLLGLAVALGAETVAGLGARERALVRRAGRVPPALVRAYRERIRAGQDPLGDALSSRRAPAERRALGAVYTPPGIVQAMTAWASTRVAGRVVDPGAGSGRFLIAAGQVQPAAELIAVDTDPAAALLARANLAVHGLARRARVVNGDFRRLLLPAHHAPTLFLGNPPYVRHHGLPARDKRWLVERARGLGLAASALSGLHVHFFLATALVARPGDYGAFVTAGEWLDVNYGSLVRALFLGPLGGVALHRIEPSARPFADADTTAVIACFSVGEQPRTVRFRAHGSSERLGVLSGGDALGRERLERAARWSTLGRRPAVRPSGHVELGELFAVHRGQVTGDNGTWIIGSDAGDLPERFLRRTVTRAKELFAAGAVLSELGELRRVLDLPVDLEELDPAERRRVDAFLRAAARRGVQHGFIARHRRAWWSVGLRTPAPILATYMARRPPAFVRNPHGAHHINVAHGLYPRTPLPGPVLDALARYLSSHTALSAGRTYSGGLTKFEPREMERVIVPDPSALRSAAGARGTVALFGPAER